MEPLSTFDEGFFVLRQDQACCSALFYLLFASRFFRVPRFSTGRREAFSEASESRFCTRNPGKTRPRKRRQAHPSQKGTWKTSWDGLRALARKWFSWGTPRCSRKWSAAPCSPLTLSRKKT